MIKYRLINSLRDALNRYTQTGKIMSSKKYGIDYGAYIKHLMKDAPLNLNDYQIDHKIPLTFFNLENLEEVKKAFAPHNLQWLSASENASKGNRIPIEILEKQRS